MTQYLHTLVLTDSERAATDEALAHFVRYCDEQLAAGAGAPFWAHRDDCWVIKAKLGMQTPICISAYFPWR